MALAGCQTGMAGLKPTDAAKAQKIYDSTCAIEPSVYATFLVVAEKTKLSDKTKKIAADAHVVVVHTCSSRPTDIITAAATLLSAYNEIATASSGAQ
jgi:hypothetical protein